MQRSEGDAATCSKTVTGYLIGGQRSGDGDSREITLRAIRNGHAEGLEVVFDEGPGIVDVGLAGGVAHLGPARR